MPDVLISVSAGKGYEVMSRLGFPIIVLARLHVLIHLFSNLIFLLGVIFSSSLPPQSVRVLVDRQEISDISVITLHPWYKLH